MLTCKKDPTLFWWSELDPFRVRFLAALECRKRIPGRRNFRNFSEAKTEAGEKAKTETGNRMPEKMFPEMKIYLKLKVMGGVKWRSCSRFLLCLLQRDLPRKVFRRFRPRFSRFCSERLFGRKFQGLLRE